MSLVNRDFHAERGFFISAFVNHSPTARSLEVGARGIILKDDRLVGMITKIADEEKGRVHPDGSISKAVSERDWQRLNEGTCISKEILIKAGADPKSLVTTFDPNSDFTVQPWLERRLGRGLGMGEALGGSLVFTPEGEDFIMLYGYFLTLKANLEPTGTGMDQTMFITMDTARDMARISRSRAEKPLEIPENSISAVLVKVAPGSSTRDVAQQISRNVPNVSAVESLDLFHTFRQQMTSLRSSVTLALGVSWVLSILLIGLLFSITANERRRETGVLRALGSTRQSVFFALLLEAAILSVIG